MGEQDRPSPAIYTTVKDLSDFIVYYERRHSDLEQRVAIMATEQNVKYDNIQRDVSSLKTGMDELKAILKNGLISQVADLVRERDKNDRRKYDLWMPMVRDWMRVGVIVVVVYIIENARVFLSALGVR